MVIPKYLPKHFAYHRAKVVTGPESIRRAFRRDSLATSAMEAGDRRERAET